MKNKKKNNPFDDEIDFSGLCVNERLKGLRQSHGLTQTDIAEVLNISKREYWRYEQQNYCTRYINLFILSVFYNVTMDYLFGLTNEQRKIYDSSTYTGSFPLCEGSMSFVIPNVETFKKQKAETKQ